MKKSKYATRYTNLTRDIVDVAKTMEENEEKWQSLMGKMPKSRQAILLLHVMEHRSARNIAKWFRAKNPCTQITEGKAHYHLYMAKRFFAKQIRSMNRMRRKAS